MKKVYIVTVFNSLNSGSYLQATSLYKAISNLGYDVSFLDTGARNLLKQAAKESVFMLKKINIKAALGKFKQAKALNRDLKEYKVTKLADLTDVNENAYVLGSDEIWNVARPDMSKYPIFWGKGLPLERCISYAPALNTAKKENLQKFDFVKEALEKLHAVSVRDRYSYDLLKNETDREIAEVCDPTILIAPEEYNKLKKTVKIKDYILVYLYAKAFRNEEKEELIRFARENNKKLVAFGSNFNWCDINVNGSPSDFISYIAGADHVCTGTFHGTLFSALLGKNFAVFGNKTKVNELLNRFGLKDRKADANNLKRVFESDYDHAKLAETIAQLRTSGLQYLEKNLREIQEMK